MTSTLRIDKLAAECNSLSSEMDFIYRSVAPSIEFSNTGRRGGKKYFSITLIELLNTLMDIKNNLAEYESVKLYDETPLRNLFSRTISRKTVNAQSTVQTLPLFALLNKFIYKANDLSTPFNEKNLNVSADLIEGAIKYLEQQLPDDKTYLESISVEEPPTSYVTGSEVAKGGENIIYYGAPGTGKSYKIDTQCDESNSIRTVFHPETQSSDFLGCLKPGMKGDDIIYSFRPGPFCLSLKLAHENKQKKVFLVIEEINRAAAASVFGEIFQLLDRNEDGRSDYAITVSDPDMLQYLEEHASSVLEGNKLRLPCNINLYATMNSSDQAVMPMDTAFKRRWKFEYIPIDFTKTNSGPAGSIPVNFVDPTVKKVSWKILANAINEILEEEDVPEDRLLGPWFLSDSEVKNGSAASASLKGKLLLYLWDDVLRHNDRAMIFRQGVKAYSALIKELENGKPIFSDKLEKLILKKTHENSLLDSSQTAKSDDNHAPELKTLEEQD